MNNGNIDLNNINREETWVDVEIIAKLKGITKRAVRMSLNNNKYIYITEKCRGGYTYRIKLSSLEEDLQIKYIKMYYNEIKTSSCELIELNNFQIKQERLISESQRDIALAKYDLIHLWLKYRKEYKANPYEETTQTINEKFVQMYNTGLLFETIFKKVGSISVGSLYRWKKLLSENQDWTALVGQYKYSTIILVGMASANHRLMRHKHLYDRLSEILKFESFSEQDVSKIIDELSEVEITDCAKKLIYSKTNRFRQLVKLINRAEQVAKSNGLNSLDEITLKEFINDEVANQDITLNFENSKTSKRA